MIFNRFFKIEWRKITFLVIVSTLIAGLEVYVYSTLPDYLLRKDTTNISIVFLAVSLNLISVITVTYFSAMLASSFSKQKIYEITDYNFPSEVIIKDLEKVSVNILLPVISICSRTISAPGWHIIITQYPKVVLLRHCSYRT